MFVACPCCSTREKRECHTLQSQAMATATQEDDTSRDEEIARRLQSMERGWEARLVRVRVAV